VNASSEEPPRGEVTLRVLAVGFVHVGLDIDPRYFARPVPAGMSFPIMTFSFRPMSGSDFARGPLA